MQNKKQKQDDIQTVKIQYNQKQTSWKIVCSNFSGMERKAVEFLNVEVGKYIIRQTGVYTLYVLPIEQESGKISISSSAIIVGQWQNSKLIQQFVKEEEIPEAGYLVKVVDNPDLENASLVIITAREQCNLFYGAVAFVDVYIPQHAPDVGGLKFANRFFDSKLSCGELKSKPKAKTRSVFAWGHPINDYRKFIQDMARLGLNQLILWNDFMPLNSKEIVECAHEYGIELIWGFAWGWNSAGCLKITDISDEYLFDLKNKVIDTFEKEYAGQGDGIYFQSFTERPDDTIGGRSIAEAVTDFVNDTAGELLKRYPSLHIQFGLHATSVRNRLDAIARVDSRIEIVWENGGVFPFDYGPVDIEDEAKFALEFENTLEFVKKIIELRGVNAPTGIVHKGFMKLDWSRFVPQSGRFLLGQNAEQIQNHDRALRSDAWRAFTANWIKNGDWARKFTAFLQNLTKGNVNLCMAGLFDGGTYFPQAVCSELFWDAERSFRDVAAIAMNKEFVISF